MCHSCINYCFEQLHPLFQPFSEELGEAKFSNVMVARDPICLKEKLSSLLLKPGTSATEFIAEGLPH